MTDTQEAMREEPRQTNARVHGCAFNGWQCFHCGEIFETVGAARTHFGTKPDAIPGCMIKVSVGAERGMLMALRKTEDLLAENIRAQLDEDTALHRELHKMQSRHSDALRNAEELGYERGLKAATAQSAEKIEYYKSANEELLEEGRNQREKIARLEESLAIFTSANDTLVAKINKELKRAAAAELSNKQLRDLRYELAGIAADVDAGKGFDIVCRKTLRRVMDALAQPISTEALDAHVAEKTAWQPIETAPKDGTEILLARFGGESNSMWWASNGSWITQFEFEGWTDGQVGDDGELEAFAVPTHWMPLPPAPEKG